MGPNVIYGVGPVCIRRVSGVSPMELARVPPAHSTNRMSIEITSCSDRKTGYPPLHLRGRNAEGWRKGRGHSTHAARLRREVRMREEAVGSGLRLPGGGRVGIF